jgi:hypothetical protein
MIKNDKWKQSIGKAKFVERCSHAKSHSLGLFLGGNVVAIDKSINML